MSQTLLISTGILLLVAYFLAGGWSSVFLVLIAIGVGKFVK